MKLKELKKVLALSVAVSMAVPGSVWAAAPGEKISVGEYEAGGGSLPEGYHYILDENGLVTILEDGSAAMEADAVVQTEDPVPETPEEGTEDPASETPEEGTEDPAPEIPEEGTEDAAPETPEEGTEDPAPETPEEGTEDPAPETPGNEEPGESEPEGDGTGNTDSETPGTDVPEGTDTENPEETVPEVPEGEETDTETPEGEETGETPEENTEEPVSEEPQNETPEAYEARTGYALPEGYQYVLDENGFVILLENGSPQIEAVSEEAPSTNEELVANQQIVQLPVMVEDFRFWTVARKYAFAVDNIEIKEEMNQESRSIGSLAKDGLCYILKEEDGWLYVESGRVRGFVQTEQVLTGDTAQELLTKYQEQAKEKAAAEGVEYTGIEGTAPMAQELVSWLENNAFLYLRATVNQTVVDKDYAVTTASLLNVREGKGTDTRIVGTLPQGSLCYILADKDQDWVYIESGDVRGFVSRQYIAYDESVKAAVEQAGEESYTTANKLVEPSDNQACYYTLTSVKSGVPGGEVRSSVVEFASQFIGNPYVWGGTSLTEGADCSGFVQSVYKEYGVDLPRVAADQAQYGTKIAVEDAQPGDLIFYARDGYVYHVVIYAGNGKTVEAMGTKYGIVQGNLNTANAVWATRVLDDTNYVYSSGDIAEVNATEDMYGDYLGNYKLTYYCSCELCCDVETGITATGTPVVEGQTIAVDPSVIPYGTQVIINGHVFTAEDCGGAIKGNRIDIYVNDHDRANALGVNYADVYLVK
ncbi:MAG TPA: C40 family peptidase [Candidatus Blautia pullistercoris]|uniref:C40 family peptidase n=1 Tax=Candidatus Blautia pullistercoris TaxID=2838499 RepID=A0A9D1VQ06_9FIRM|nr:C40 family peptidase [Candidatus Blautia pullistercoris]